MKKLSKFLKKSSLTIMILLSIIGFNAYDSVRFLLNQQEAIITNQQEDNLVQTDEKEITSEVPAPEPALESTNKTDETPTPESKEKGYPVQYKKIPLRKARSPYYDDYDKIALTTNYPYRKSETDYFDDALFIGDSRVEGLFEYGNINNATFFCKEGLNIYDLKDKFLDRNGKETLTHMLSKNQYGKVYIMIGVNELGRGNAKDFKKKYEEVLTQIRKLQPNTILYVMGMMHVTTKYSDENDVFNNDNINRRNALVASLTDGIQSFYLDMNEVIDDSEGGLISTYSWDGIHIKAEYYSLWVDFLKEHSVLLNK